MVEAVEPSCLTQTSGSAGPRVEGAAAAVRRLDASDPARRGRKSGVALSCQKNRKCPTRHSRPPSKVVRPPIRRGQTTPTTWSSHVRDVVPTTPATWSNHVGDVVEPPVPRGRTNERRRKREGGPFDGSAFRCRGGLLLGVCLVYTPPWLTPSLPPCLPRTESNRLPIILTSSSASGRLPATALATAYTSNIAR